MRRVFHFVARHPRNMFPRQSLVVYQVYQMISDVSDVARVKLSPAREVSPIENPPWEVDENLIFTAV